jgi:DNA helicase IV
VQGGPGTGKTAVGLHRASWLLYTHRDTLARRGVLVIGPNRTFMDYVSHVLPALGEEAVEQRAVTELVDGVEATLRDLPDVAALKADVRLAEVVRRAVEEHLAGAPEELVLRLDGSFVQVREREVRELLDEARDELGTTAAARDRFRMNVLRRFYEDYGRVHGDLALRSFDEVEKAVRAKGLLDRILKAAWPVVTPAQVVHAVLSSPASLERAADGILDAGEQRLLVRRGRAWSDGDLPLLDEASALLDGPPHAYGHVIVDEAQDLTPMQLRMVARRAPGGSLTLLGDIAQATGPVVHRAWAALTTGLPAGDEAAVEELRHAYRVPREIMELALPLLDAIAPGLEPPLSYRMGAAPPRIRQVAEADLLAEAWREAAALAAGDGLLAVIAPEELTPGPSPGDLWDGIPLLAARAAKGLEFDHVVVVEPALIAAHEQGLRELYVALTRPTRTLVVLHARPLPDALSRSGSYAQ